MFSRDWSSDVCSSDLFPIGRSSRAIRGCDLAVANRAEGPPDRASREYGPEREEHAAESPAEVVEPVVRAQVQAAGRLGQVQDQAHAPAREVLELLHERGEGDSDGESREREVEAGEPERREPED